jgi:hypothetical protein
MRREQLVLLALITFIALLDLVSRWARGRRTEPEPTYRREEPVYDEAPVYDEEPVYDEAPVYDEEPVFTLEREPEWLESGSAEAEPPSTWAEPAGPPPIVREPRTRKATPAPLRPVVQAPAQSATRPRRRAHWLRHPVNARRGIVMMTVLGRCRGLN